MDPTAGEAPGEAMDGGGDEDPAGWVVATADAAAAASRDAEEMARSASDTASSAEQAATRAAEVARSANSATASMTATVTGAVETAARAGESVQADARARTASVVSSALVALEKIVDELPDDLDADSGTKVAALLADAAAGIFTLGTVNEQAVATVLQAVTAAEEVTLAASETATTLVEVVTADAEKAARFAANSSISTEDASGVVVASTAHVDALARRRAAELPQAPLVAELRRALNANELRLHFQLMYDLSTGVAVGAEALLRWQHPTRGLLTPANFLEVAEGPHLVKPIGDWVIQSAIAQAASWARMMGDMAPRVWANVSCDQLGSQHLPALVDRLLNEHEVDPRHLGIEVTERQLARRIRQVEADLMALRELGVALAVDDFGTGYASLDYLRRFALDEIKVDRSFVSGLEDRTNIAVTSSIVALGLSLGLVVVAEGVETQAQRDRVHELGCPVAQGYLFHRPAPASEIDHLLRQ